MNRFITPVTVWKTFTYKCQECGETFKMHLQVGVEGPTENCIPSPFSLNCPKGCKGFFPVTHIDWHKDRDIEQRNAKDGEYVFLYDHETGCGTPVQITDSVNWVAKTPFYGKTPRTLYLNKQEVDEEKLARRHQEVLYD